MQARSIFLALLLFFGGIGVGYYWGRHPAGSDAIASKTEPIGKWRAQIDIPGSVELPTENPIIKFTFTRTKNFKVGYLTVTHENLTDRSYMVNYAIFGYDEKGRRISEGFEEFLIGKHESVVKQVLLDSQASPLSFKFGSVFAIQMFPE